MWRAVLILAVLVRGAAAAEEYWPRLYEVRIFAGAATSMERSGSRRFDDTFGYCWGTQGVIRHRIGAGFGMLMLLGAHVHQHAGEQEGANAITSDYTASGGEIGLGLFWHGSTRLHLELMPSYRFGRGKIAIEDTTGTLTGASDIYQAWCASLGCFYTWPYGMQIGITAGWSDWTGDSSLNGEDVRSHGAGPQATMSLGYSF